MNKDETITLGGREFPVAPLTLGQLRQAGPAFTRIGIDTQTAVIGTVIESRCPLVVPASPRRQR